MYLIPWCNYKFVPSSGPFFLFKGNLLISYLDLSYAIVLVILLISILSIKELIIRL